MPTPAPKAAAPEPTAPATIASLLDKGGGSLVKRGGVWTFPGAPNDRSGTNLVMPAESVSDAAVQDALSKGDVVVKAVDLTGAVTAVGKPAAEVAAVRVVNIAQAGSVDASTELPPNSRPTHDAGRDDRPVDVARAQRIVDPAKAPTPGLPAGATVAPQAAAPATAPAGAPTAAQTAPTAPAKANG